MHFSTTDNESCDVLISHSRVATTHDFLLQWLDVPVCFIIRWKIPCLIPKFVLWGWILPFEPAFSELYCVCLSVGLKNVGQAFLIGHGACFTLYLLIPSGLDAVPLKFYSSTISNMYISS